MGCSVMVAGSSREGEGRGVGPGEEQGRSKGHRFPLSHPSPCSFPGPTRGHTLSNLSLGRYSQTCFSTAPSPQALNTIPRSPNLSPVPGHLHHTLQPYSKDHHAILTGDRHTPFPRTRYPWDSISNPQDPLLVCSDPLKTLKLLTRIGTLELSTPGSWPTFPHLLTRLPAPSPPRAGPHPCLVST